MLEDEPARWEIIRGELKQIAQTFGSPRRTRIEVPTAPLEFREEDYIVDEDSWVIVTRDGWTKRQKSFTDVASIRVRDDDRVGWVYRARARQTLTFFTDRGIAYTMRVNDIADDDGPRRADPEAVRVRGSGAYRRRHLPRPALPARLEQAPADAAEAGPAAAGRRCRPGHAELKATPITSPAKSTATAAAPAFRHPLMPSP